jgi:hypothetical protein
MSCSYQKKAVVGPSIPGQQHPLVDPIAPKRLLTCPIKQFLLARLAKSTDESIVRSRLDLHALNSARGGLHLTKLHVLVEPSQVDEAEKWVEAAMKAAYGGESLHIYWKK